MPDQHQESKATVRPPAALKAAAQKVLAEHGVTLNQFFVACLLLLIKRPKTFMKQLEPLVPPLKNGRPPKHPKA